MIEPKTTQKLAQIVDDARIGLRREILEGMENLNRGVLDAYLSSHDLGMRLSKLPRSLMT